MKIITDSPLAKAVEEEIRKRQQNERMTFMYEDGNGKPVVCRSALTEADILNAEPISDPKRREWLEKVRKKYGIEIE